MRRCFSFCRWVVKSKWGGGRRSEDDNVADITGVSFHGVSDAEREWARARSIDPLASRCLFVSAPESCRSWANGRIRVPGWGEIQFMKGLHVWASFTLRFLSFCVSYDRNLAEPYLSLSLFFLSPGVELLISASPASPTQRRFKQLRVFGFWSYNQAGGGILFRIDKESREKLLLHTIQSEREIRFYACSSNQCSFHPLHH